jgi:predicted GTPase
VFSAYTRSRAARSLGILRNFKHNDPIAVFLGKRGVGKSTTLNRLFGSSFATDPSMECTRRPQLFRTKLANDVTWQIVDMPGIGADMNSSGQYARYYRQWMGKADVVVWITQADVRAYKQDQGFFISYGPLVRSGTRLVLAISKIDTLVVHDGLIDPDLLMADGTVQRKIIDVQEQLARYSWATRDQVSIVPYSITKDWNITALSDSILNPRPTG